jgi:hypothetical protein
MRALLFQQFGVWATAAAFVFLGLVVVGAL